MIDEKLLRDHLAKLLDWQDAHVNFDRVVDDFPAEDRGRRPAGLPYSAWEVLEHIRRGQHGILDFSVNPNYEEVRWPDDYWPETPKPPTSTAWDESIASYRKERDALRKLALDPALDLGARVPQGNGQTYLREIVLAADHAAYHVGELVTIRRLLGCWK
jgi:hypothetical protein